MYEMWFKVYDKITFESSHYILHVENNFLKPMWGLFYTKRNLKNCIMSVNKGRKNNSIAAFTLWFFKKSGLIWTNSEEIFINEKSFSIVPCVILNLL